MNSPTRDIISPSLIKVTKRLQLELHDTVRDAGILSIVSRAALLDHGTERDFCDFLDGDVVEVGACAGFCPGLEVGDPGVVAEDEAVVIELPEGDLLGTIYRGQTWKERETIWHGRGREQDKAGW